MKARQLIESSSFAPEALLVIYQAFDQAWEDIAAEVGPDPTAIAFARNRLAHAVLAAAKAEAKDPAALKEAALKLFGVAPPPSNAP